MVITQWDWGLDSSYIHDNVSTDKRNPTLYANGKVWGIDIGQSFLWALDPKTHTVTLARGAAAGRTGARPRATGPHSGEHELAQPDARRQGQCLADDSRAQLPEHAEMGSRRDVDIAGGSEIAERARPAIQPATRLLR